MLTEIERELTKAIAIYLRKTELDVLNMPEEDLLDLMEKHWKYFSEKRENRNYSEAEYSQHNAEDVKTLLKERLKRLRAENLDL